MADTIITNTPNSGDDGSSAGLVVTLVVIFAVIIGGVVMYQKGFFNTATPDDPSTTNINVTVPNPVSPAPVTE